MAKRASDVRVGGAGPFDCDAMIIGEAPGKDEEKQRMPFVGKTGQELDRLYLRVAGLLRFRCYITNVYKYRPLGNATPTPAQIAEGLPELKHEISQVRTRFIITLGEVAHSVFADTPLALQHGLAYNYFDKTIIPCYHPAMGLHASSGMTMLLDDFDAVRRYMSGEWKPRPYASKPEVNFITASEVIDVPMLLAGEQVVAIDTESGVDGKPYLVQVSVDGQSAVIIRADDTVNLVLLNDCLNNMPADGIIVMHNAKYDLKQLWQLGVYPPTHLIRDTMQMAYLLGNLPKGLKALAYRLLNYRMSEWVDIMEHATKEPLMEYIRHMSQVEWPAMLPVPEFVGTRFRVRQPQSIQRRAAALLRKVDELPALEIYRLLKKFEGLEVVEQRMGRAPEPTCADVEDFYLLPYASADAVMTWKLYHVLWERVKSEGLEKQLEIDHGAIVYTAIMESNGILMDVAKLQELDADLEQRASELFAKIQTTMYTEYGLSRDKIFNPASSDQVLWLMDKLKQPVRSTQAKYIEPLAKRFPVIADILAYKRLRKLQSTYVRPMQKARITSDFSLTRTDTGRLASSKPNIQNIPVRTKDGKKIREAIIAPAGHKIVVIDYSQIEMRLAAHLSSDPVLLDVFLTGKDIHTETSLRIFGDADKEHRYAAKRAGFGVLYGISGKGLAELLASEGLEGWDEPLCQNLIDAWFRTYKGVAAHMRQVEVEIVNTGRVRDLFGRYRLVPEIRSSHKWIKSAGLRQGINAPIQSSAAGIIKKAMGDLVPCLSMFVDVAWPILQVHDELVFTVKEGEIDTVVPVIKNIMEQAVPLQVPVTCDVEIGDCYGVIDEWKIQENEEEE